MPFVVLAVRVLSPSEAVELETLFEKTHAVGAVLKIEPGGLPPAGTVQSDPVEAARLDPGAGRAAPYFLPIIGLSAVSGLESEAVERCRVGTGVRDLHELAPVVRSCGVIEDLIDHERGMGDSRGRHRGDQPCEDAEQTVSRHAPTSAAIASRAIADGMGSEAGMVPVVRDHAG